MNESNWFSATYAFNAFVLKNNNKSSFFQIEKETKTIGS